MSEDFSDRQLRWAYWWVTHRDGFVRAGRILFIGSITVLWLVSLVLWGLFAWREWQYQEFMRALNPAPIDFTAYRTRVHAEALSFGDVTLMPVGSALVDAAVVAENPNTDWVARVTYQFADGRSLLTTTVLPGERKFLLDLGVPRGAAFRDNPILDIGWHRIRGYEQLAEERLQLHVHSVVDGDRTSPEFFSGRSASIPYPRVTFTVTNQGAYTYTSPAFSIALWDGNAVVAVHRIVTDTIHPGETRMLDATWPDDIAVSPFVRVEVTPDIDITDSAAFVR